MQTVLFGRLRNGRSKQKLLARVILEVVVTADVDQGGGLGLGRSEALVPMREDLAAEFQAVAEPVFQQEAAVGKVTVLGLRNNRLAGAAVEQPVPDVLLLPQLNSKAGPVESTSAGIPSIAPKM